MKKIEFYKHNLSIKDKKAALSVLDSIFLTTGEVTKTFEKNFADYVNMPYVVGLSSCTDALFLALKGLGIGDGDEVITTPLSFIASSNAIEYTSAKTVFVDVEAQTGNIDAKRISKAITPATKAILVVHLYGQMCDMKAIHKIARQYKLKIIEDCAHCIEGQRDGIRVGELSDAACFSFYATKNITSAEGGALATHDKRLYEWALQARQHGMSKGAADRYTKKYQHYEMEFLGYKCNMTNLQAALLLNQLEHIDEFREKKEKIAKTYDQAFSQNAFIKTPVVLPNTVHGRHLYTIWVNTQKRDSYLHALQEMGIGVAVNFRAIHLMKYYREKYGYQKGDFPNAEYIGDATISLPFYPKLTKNELNTIVKIVNKTTQTV